MTYSHPDLGTQRLYHGTSSTHLQSLKQGIVAQGGRNFQDETQLGPGWYTTPDMKAAEYFALVSCVHAGGTPVLLLVHGHQPSWTSMDVPEQHWWDVPQHYLTQYAYLVAPIAGLPMWVNVKFNPHVCSFLWVTEVP